MEQLPHYCGLKKDKGFQTIKAEVGGHLHCKGAQLKPNSGEELPCQVEEATGRRAGRRGVSMVFDGSIKTRKTMGIGSGLDIS